MKRALLVACFCLPWAVVCYAQGLRPDQISPGTPDLTWQQVGSGYQIGSTIPWRTETGATLTTPLSAADNAKIVELTFNGAISTTLPAATSGNNLGDGAGFALQVGPGTLTLSAAAGTLNGGGSLTVGPYQMVSLVSKNSKWYADLSVSAPGVTGGAPTISGVTLSNGLNFTTPAAANSTIDTLTATCSAGSCAGATFGPLATTGACSGATSNGSFAISGSNLNIGGTTISTAGNYPIGIPVTLAGATNTGTCYPQTLVGAASGGAPTGSCTESTAFFARVWALPATLDGPIPISGTAGPTNHLKAYDDLICNLNGSHDNVLPFMDALWVPATDDATHTLATAQKIANLNLKSSSFTLIPVGSPTFVANTGYVSNTTSTPPTEGTTGIYLNTQFTPSAGGTQYVLGGALIHAWTFRSWHSGTQYEIMGADDATQTAGILPWSAGTTTNFQGNLSDAAPGGSVSSTVSDSTGSSVVVRLSSVNTPGSLVLYRNGAALSSTNGSSAVGLVTIPLDLGGENYHGTHYASPWPVAAGGFGGNLTAPFVSSLLTTPVTSANAATGTGLVPRICVFLTAVHGSC